MSNEVWKPVVGYENRYLVSDQGRIKSLARKEPRILRPGRVGPRRKQYNCVDLCSGHGTGSKRAVHLIVLEAFVGPRPEGFYGCHHDDDTSNNKLENLYWASPNTNNGRDRNQNGSYSSKYNGVCRHSINPRWTVQVSIGKKNVYIGSFKEEIEAAKAFDAYCRENHLDKHLNFAQLSGTS